MSEIVFSQFATVKKKKSSAFESEKCDEKIVTVNYYRLCGNRISLHVLHAALTFGLTF